VVFEAGRCLLVGPPLENAVFHQGSQPRAQDVARDSEPLPEVIEAMCAREDLAHDAERPAFAHHRQRPGNRAGCGAAGP